MIRTTSVCMVIGTGVKGTWIFADSVRSAAPVAISTRARNTAPRAWAAGQNCASSVADGVERDGAPLDMGWFPRGVLRGPVRPLYRIGRHASTAKLQTIPERR